MAWTTLLIDGLTRRNVGYFAWSRRAGEPAIKPMRTRSTIGSPAIVAIAIVGFDEEEPTRPLTPSAWSSTSARRASASFRCVSRTRTSIYKTTTSVFHIRYTQVTVQSLWNLSTPVANHGINKIEESDHPAWMACHGMTTQLSFLGRSKFIISLA